MAGGAQAMKRIPRIKFPQRHPAPSAAAGSSSGKEEASEGVSPNMSFFSRSSNSTTASVGGKASLQPKRTPVNNDEIEAIMSFPVDNDEMVEQMELIPDGMGEEEEELGGCI